MHATQEAIQLQSLKSLQKRMLTSLDEVLIECEPRSIIKTWIFGIFSASGGFFYGFYFGQFNNFFEFFIRGKFEESIQPKDYDGVQSILNGFIVSGGLLCSILGGTLLKNFSPKLLTLICMISLFILNTLQIWAPLYMLYAIRFLIGFVVCLYSYLGPIMVARCLPSKFVGPLGAWYNITLNIGLLAAYAITSDISEQYWEIFLCVPVLFELFRFILFVGFFYVESPYFAYSSIVKSSDPENPTFSIKDAFMKDPHINKLVETFFKEEDYGKQKRFLYNKINHYFSQQAKAKGIIKTACSKETKASFVAASILSMTQQLTGITFIHQYSRQIFIDLGFENASLLVLMGGKF